MRTVDEWLALGDELGAKAAEVLVPGPWKHNSKNQEEYGFSSCSKCGEINTNGRSKYCKFPDPIKIDWNVAHRFKGQITDKVFDLALSRVMKAQLEGVGLGYYTQYAIHHARPRHYIIAACMAKESKI